MKLGLLRQIIVLAPLSVGVGAVAQVPPTELTVRSQSPTVSVPFLTQDGHGHASRLVTSADLSISDNGKPPQSIVAIRNARELPLRLGVLIDTSNSERVSALYIPGVHATRGLLNQVLNGPEDRVFLETFDTVPNASGFMKRDEALNFKMNLNPGGASALFDAIYLACNDRMEGDPIQPARRVLVILSDGGDNFSHVDHNKAIAAAQQVRTIVFFISTSENARDDLDGRRLQLFADKTGGLAFLHLNPTDIPKVFSTIGEQIENMYAVTYVPSDLVQLGQYRSIELKAKSDKKLKLHAPKGYYVNAGLK
jgi:Ca-activated chloride channel family protein